MVLALLMALPPVSRSYSHFFVLSAHLVVLYKVEVPDTVEPPGALVAPALPVVAPPQVPGAGASYD